MADQLPAETLTAKQMATLSVALRLDGDYTAEDIKELVVRGACQAWPWKESIAITEIRVFPRQRALNVWLASGKMEDILALEPFVVDFAKENGCSKLTLTGRTGWDRALKHWDRKTITMTRSL